MGFMEYANMHQCNIIPKEEFKTLTTEVFNVIASNLGRSLGPLGSSATILDGMLTEATKDGYSILSHYRFNNRYKRMVLNLIQAPCTKMNNTVGDGTTTVIVLTSKMFNRFQNQQVVLESNYRLPRQLTHAWDQVIEELIQRIYASATPLDHTDYDKLYHLAYVVSNGNDAVSRDIAKIYQESPTPAIKMKDSPTNKSYIQKVDGFAFPTNAIDSVYTQNSDLSTTEQNVAVLIFGIKVTKDIMDRIILPMTRVMKAMNKKLVLVAPAYDDTLMENYLAQMAVSEARQYGHIQTILTQYRMSDTENHQLDDLGVILQAKQVHSGNMDAITELVQASPDRFYEMCMDETSDFHHILSFADQVMITCRNGSIFQVKDAEKSELYQKTLREANADLTAIMETNSAERNSYSHKVYDARARIMQLQMQNYIYYIGADSELQRQILWDSVEDVIKCMHSAIRYGVVPGCQITVIRHCRDMIRELTEGKETLSKEDRLRVLLLDIIELSCRDVYMAVLHGPEFNGIVKTLPDWDTVNPTDEALCQKLADRAVRECADIVKESIKKNLVYDLETLTYNEAIITSAETDAMVLQAAGELIKILISGNQCIVLDSDVDSSHQEIREVYV